MSVDFTIQHQRLADVNMELQQSAQGMRQILNRLEDVLKNMSAATGGAALPLWQGRQNQWNAAYNDMNDNLVKHAVTSDEIAQIFVQGDKSGALAFG